MKVVRRCCISMGLNMDVAIRMMDPRFTSGQSVRIGNTFRLIFVVGVEPGE